MTGQGSERPDKGKEVARPKKRQRQTPKYVLRVPAKLPTIAARSTSYVGSPPTPTIQPPTPVVDPTPSSAIHPYPTPAVHPSPTLAAHPSTTPATHPSTTPTAYPLPPHVIINPTPPPMVITPTSLPDPTSIPSSSCISPSETVTPSADPDSSGDGEGLDPPLHDRPWIEPYAIPDDDKKPFWERFQMKVQWKHEHETQIQRNFHMKASHRLSEMFKDARNAGERPYWLGEQIWNSLLAHWNTVEFRNKCAKAQRNRASEKGGTLHTGGSITIHEHVIRMEEISTRLSQVRSEHASAPTPDDVSNVEDDIRRTQCWVDIVGGKKKGRVYGVGQLAANYTTSRGGTLKHQPSSSTTTADEDEFNIPPTQPRPSSSPAVPQQPTSVEPSSVQPTLVQPSIEEQDDEDHSDDNYVHY
ncbi:hypothetical protein LR48_Vigan233s001800 [Vigna angularis]|uniref:Transposase, Ptta/En/Spm, plant n=1 Tax=Phaseolus angularis TaxID=3914 RepID=A0A0L9T728_PHAAN|nr:hypothetical protein LR48_Vigan233s001800 [Vigna angularis]